MSPDRSAAWCPKCAAGLRELEPGVAVCLDRMCPRWRAHTRPVLAALRRRTELTAGVVPFYRGGRAV